LHIVAVDSHTYNRSFDNHLSIVWCDQQTQQKKKRKERSLALRAVCSELLRVYNAMSATIAATSIALLTAQVVSLRAIPSCLIYGLQHCTHCGRYIFINIDSHTQLS
jgi:hypothetical protein